MRCRNSWGGRFCASASASDEEDEDTERGRLQPLPVRVRGAPGRGSVAAADALAEPVADAWCCRWLVPQVTSCEAVLPHWLWAGPLPLLLLLLKLAVRISTCSSVTGTCSWAAPCADVSSSTGSIGGEAGGAIVPLPWAAAAAAAAGTAAAAAVAMSPCSCCAPACVRGGAGALGPSVAAIDQPGAHMEAIPWPAARCSRS